MGRPSIHRRPSWRRVLSSAVLGAVLAFVTYWTGALLAGLQDLIQASPQTLPSQFQRPFTIFTAWEIVFVGFGFVIGAMVGRYRWRLPGLLGLIGLLSLAVGYLAYAVWVTIPAVPDHLRWLSYVLFAAEAGLLALVFMAAFYSFDVTTRRRWSRLPSDHVFDEDLRPHVCLQIPAFNEPPEMVRRTVDHAMAQDYPRDRLTVMLLDDSTDERVRQELAAHCEAVGAWYVHRTDRRGFKAGALNHGRRLLPEEVEVVGIIDADYWVKPDWLRSLVGHFAEGKLGFVQTPQDYRNKEESFLTRQYYRAEAYFYHAMMPSRNEESAIIFCGTMGLIRRDALEDVGGFAEDQICEDAEISVRVVARGWTSLYVDQSFGVGLMPATFDAYKKQFHRWAFGNVKILYTHWLRILRSRMSARQKFDYVVTNLHWFDGLLIMVVASSLLYLGLGPIVGYEAETYHQNEVFMIALVPTLLLIDSVVRLRGVLRQAGHGRLRDALLVQGMWFAIKFTNLRAVLKASLGFNAPFVRTPKTPDRRLGRFRSFVRAVRVTKFESLLTSVLLTVAVWDATIVYNEPIGKAILPVWLGMYAAFFGCAPLYAYLSYRTLRPLHAGGTAPAPNVRGQPVVFRESS